MRFFARKLGTVERYFRKNTSNIESLACNIGQGLAEQVALRDQADKTDSVFPSLML